MISIRTALLLPILCLPLAGAGSGRAALPAGEEVVEYWPDQTVKARYGVNEDGLRSGSYLEYWPDGELRIKCRYKAGELDGRYQSYHESGARENDTAYKAGQLNGKYQSWWPDGGERVEGRYKKDRREGLFVFSRAGQEVSRQEWKAGELRELDGLVPFPRSREQLIEGLQAIAAPPLRLATESRREGAIPPELAVQRELALRRLQAYRFLSDLPYQDMGLDPDFNYYCSAAARLLEKLGRLDHQPPNPGLDEPDYRDGYEGTSHSNLSQGPGLVGAIDSYMDDSDATNIERVGHRRWCLNPPMAKTGFGIAGRFSAMWSFDESGKAPDWSAIAYPAPGHYPVEYFGGRHAWSVRFEPGDWSEPQLEDLEVLVLPLDADYVPAPEPLPLDHLSVSLGQVIFRPEGLEAAPGRSYRVLIAGLEGPHKADRFEYVIEFFSLAANERE